jgi:F0F1-type ATP synthase assembly protein I
MGDIGRTLDTFGKEKLGPAIGVAVKALDNSVQISLSQQLLSINLEKKKLGPAAKEGAKSMGENPVEASLIVGSALPLFVPSLVSGPVLWMFGWVLELVHFPPPLFLLIVLEIGLAAAVIQAAAGGAFATVQSAAMGGYGVVVVNTAVRVEAAVLGAGVD